MLKPGASLLTAFLFATAVGCSDGGEEVLPPLETGVDDTSTEEAAVDTGVEVDTGSDPDTGTVPDTATGDSGADTTIVDSGADTAIDSATDSTIVDTGSPDTAPVDTGSPDTGTGPVACATASDCPGSDAICEVRACIGGLCTMQKLPSGTATSVQLEGDCKKNTCDGAGLVAVTYDPTDLPNDLNECTVDICSGLTPTFLPKVAGAACSTGGGTMCDGAGNCAECLVATTCPGVDTDCRVRTCTAGKCGMMNLPDGAVAATQTPGDCKVTQCDGAGATKIVNDDADLPNDGNACTTDSCSGGAPAYANVMDGTLCGGGTNSCVGGSCVGCVTAATCPGADTECATRTCSASGVCGFDYAMAGTVLTTGQVANDCKKKVCNGSGAIVDANDDADLPVDDGKECTTSGCSSGTTTHTPVTPGTRCNKAATADGYCSGAGDCVECLDATACTASGPCYTATCSGAGACGNTPTPDGTPTAAQTPDDCREVQCNGLGATKTVEKDDRTPDANLCTLEQCTGVPMTPTTGNASTATACTLSGGGGGKCNGSGTCVQCNVDGDCTGGATCSMNVCSATPCSNSTKDANESDVDCGGTSSCSRCSNGKACTAGTDCASTNCVSTANVCGPNDLVISEIQTRGSNGGNDDFIEIYNPTNAAITFSSAYTVWNTNGDNTTANYGLRYTGTGTSIGAHRRFLITNNAGSGYDGGVAANATYASGIKDAGSVVLKKNIVGGSFGTGTTVDAVCYYYNATTLTRVSGSSYICNGSIVDNAPHNDGTTGSSNTDVSIERVLHYVDTDSTADWTPASGHTSTPQNLSSAASP